MSNGYILYTITKHIHVTLALQVYMKEQKVPWVMIFINKFDIFFKAIFRDFWATETPYFCATLCSKFQLAMILRWQDMRENIYDTFPLNTVL